MAFIVKYQKYINALTTRALLLPNDPVAHGGGGVELCTIDNNTYVALPDGAVLPAEQPAEIAESIEVVTLTDALRDAIRSASAHVRLINQRVQEAIAERYSLTDEIKLLRTAPSPEYTEYNAYAEECRAWGRAEKAKLGL